MSKATKRLHTIPQPKAEQIGHKAADLPELPNNHGDKLDSVTFGPRREMILKISPLRWAGNKGYYGSVMSIRFGSIVNYEEVQETFKSRYCKESELDRIEYDQGQFSKPGDLHLVVGFERLEVRIFIHCHSLTVTEPDTEQA